jgi:hypothetical protein
MRRTILFSLYLATEFMLMGLAFASDIPVPAPKPSQTNKPVEAIAPPPAKLETPPIGTSTCQSELHALGVTFKPMPPVSDPIGCSIADPVEVTALGPNIALAPAALLDCQTALKLSTFIRDDAQKITISTLGSTIASITQASAYVCRTRHGATKLSEHAFGRALDIASFILSDKRIILVQDPPANEAKTKLYLDLVRAKACGPFTTVLGPGSDPDHALHFHFDLAPRKGHAFCQ